MSDQEVTWVLALITVLICVVCGVTLWFWDPPPDDDRTFY